MTTNKKQEIDKITEAKQLLAAEEKKQGDLAVEIIKKAVEEIDKLGFIIITSGEFIGNNIKSYIKVVKKQV